MSMANLQRMAMDPMTRRSFLQLSARLAAVLGLARSAVPALAETLAQLANGSIVYSPSSTDEHIVRSRVSSAIIRTSSVIW